MSRSVPILENRQPTAEVFDDVAYFESNPNEGSYERAATKQECDMYGLPYGTRCLVVKLGPSKHMRMFQSPDSRRN